MARKKMMSPQEFAAMEEEFMKEGFRKTYVHEYYDDRDRLGLFKPTTRRVEGVQVRFLYTANNITIVVCCTYVEDKKGFCWLRSAKVLAREGDDIQYETRQIRRTKNFAYRLMMYAKALRTKILHRPRCEKCGRFMRIDSHWIEHQFWWTCTRNYLHADRKYFCTTWDENLEVSEKEFLEKMRKPGIKYRKKLNLLGKPTHQSRRKRKRWHQANPQNKVRMTY